MVVMNLVDVSNYGNTCGILVCNNKAITRKIIQEKIDEIKGEFNLDGVDWMISDVIGMIPNEWKVKYYASDNTVNI